MIVVSDTSPISALFLTNRIDLLERIFGQVIIPTMVMSELEELKDFGLDIGLLKTLPWLSVRTVQNLSEVAAFQTQLDPGESEAIVLAKELQADYVLIDEKEGRSVASKEGLKVVGLLGVLSFAKKAGYIPLVKPVLDDLIENANFWVGQGLYNQYLRMEGE